jgi:predicted DNA-binding transcriptional regulator AlpA
MRSNQNQKSRQAASVELPQLLSTKQAAQILGLSPMTLRIWRVAGRKVGLGYVKVGPRIVRYERSEIARFLRSRRRS